MVLTWQAEWSAVSSSAREDSNPAPGPTLGTTCDLNHCLRGPISRTALGVGGPHVDVGGHGPPEARRGRAGACGWHGPPGAGSHGCQPGGPPAAVCRHGLLGQVAGRPGFRARPRQSQHGRASRPEHSSWPPSSPQLAFLVLTLVHLRSHLCGMADKGVRGHWRKPGNWLEVAAHVGSFTKSRQEGPDPEIKTIPVGTGHALGPALLPFSRPATATAASAAMVTSTRTPGPAGLGGPAAVRWPLPAPCSCPSLGRASPAVQPPATWPLLLGR